MSIIIMILMIAGTIWYCSTHESKSMRGQRIDAEAQARARQKGDATFIGSRGELRSTKNGHVAAFRPIKDENGKVIGREVCDISKHGLPTAPVVDREYGKPFLGA